ncbi:MAG: phenylalanine--tRNA ligase subunit alpha, partial [Limisphaerales bacterium]
MLQEIEPLKNAAITELTAASDLPALDQARIKYLGANGSFTALLKQLGTLPKEERPGVGKLINEAKAKIDELLTQRRGELELKSALPKEPTDFSLPGRRPVLGKLHPHRAGKTGESKFARAIRRN